MNLYTLLKGQMKTASALCIGELWWTPVCTGMPRPEAVLRQSPDPAVWTLLLEAQNATRLLRNFESNWSQLYIQSTRHFKGVGLSRSLVVGCCWTGSIWQSVFDDAAASRPVAMFLLDQDLVGEDDFDQKHLRTAGVQKIHWCTCLITTWCKNRSSCPEV